MPPPIANSPAPPRRSARGLIVGHTGFHVANYHTTYVFGLLFPAGAGVVFYGWRAAGAIGIVLATVVLATLVWRQVGVRGHTLRPAQLFRLGLLLALLLPARLAANPPAKPWLAEWPLLPAAGLLLVLACWLAGAAGAGRFHPVLWVYLAIALAFPLAMRPQTVLQRTRLAVGDVLRRDGPVDPHANPDPWRKRPLAPAPADAVACPAVGEPLLAFTRGRSADAVGSVDTLLRTRLPPLEDLVLGAAPGPIGATSGVAVIIGGLFLLYRGLIDFRVPLLVIVTAWGMLLLLPVALPTGTGSVHWQWLPGSSPDVGWAAGITLANYELLGSPLLFTAFFLAGSPSVRPLGRSARSVYAAAIGAAAAALQLYVSVELGSYLAVVAVGVIAASLDRWVGTRPLVGRA